MNTKHSRIQIPLRVHPLQMFDIDNSFDMGGGRVREGGPGLTERLCALWLASSSSNGR